MVNYNSRIYTEEEGQVRGIEVTIFTTEGDKIDSLHISNDADFNTLKENLEGLDEVYVKFSNLGRALDDVIVNAQTLDNLSSTDFARAEHDHGDIYSRKDHSDNENIFGIGTSTKYGHNKIINNLNSQTANDGESLSAYQGKVLDNKISALRNDASKWTKMNVTNYGSLWINATLRMCFMKYYRENYTLTKNANVTLHTGAIPAQYRFSGAFQSSPSSPYTVLSVTREGNITLRTNYQKTTNTTLRGWWFWIY